MLSFDPTPWITRGGILNPFKLHAPIPKNKLIRDPKNEKTVCVIGGGIAGLVAAHELKKLGHKVTLLEADGRSGGRIYTYHFPDIYDGKYYGELGAMRFPFDHLCTWHYITEFGLKRATFVQENGAAFYHLRTKKFRQEPWPPRSTNVADLYPLVRPSIISRSPGNVLDGWFRKLIPKFLFFQLLHLGNAFSPGRPLTGRLRYWDRFSVWQHFQFRNLFPGPVINDEEQEYIGRATGMLSDEQNSYLEALTAKLPHYFPTMSTLEGGMSRLIDAFENALPDEIKLNAPVTKVTIKKDGVRVEWRSEGQCASEEFDYVVCAVQAGATVGIKFDPPLSPPKYEALTNISYQSAAKSIVLCSSRPWEFKDKIYGGGSRTDFETQECWYPPDNAIEADKPDPRRLPKLVTDILGGDQLGEDVWNAKDPEVSDGPGVLIAAYMRGTNARRFASLTDDQRDTLVRTSLEELHPGIGKTIKRIKHHSWDVQFNPGGGAWAAFAPGERSRYQQAMVEPHRYEEDEDPRVFFAGDHLGINHGWIQSAIQTAQGAVWHIHKAS
jgi:monoamine oxidase